VVENLRRTGGYKEVIGSRKPKKNRRIQRGNRKSKIKEEQEDTKG
jgi:hypothetical protein